MNKAPDRESKFLTNGTYFAKIFSITQDLPSKTATGTIAIQVEDFNDHCPTLTSKNQSLCTDKDAILVTAMDGDADPNGPPFTFNIVDDGTKGKWTIEHLNDTTVIFRTHEKMWPGQYELTVEVKDQQGLSCPVPEKLKVEVCTCTNQGSCNRVNGPAARKGSTLGSAGIGLLLLGLLALLLIPLLLLLCQCGSAGFVGPFADMPYDTKEHLIAYHTEGQGEDRDVPVLIGDEHDSRFGYTKIGGGGGVVAAAHEMGRSGMAGMDQGGVFMDSLGMRVNSMRTYNSGAGMYSTNSMQWNSGMAEEAGGFDGMAASEQFLDEYYSQKSRAIEDGFAKNNILEYQNEGNGSLAGSVEAISMLEDDNDLAFLNDLGPKFNTLAQVCGGKMTTVEQDVPLPPPPKPVERTVVSSDQFDFNSSMAANTVNMASNASSSTRVENVLVTENRPTVYASVQPTTTLLVQQQQPMYYMVEQQPSTVLLAERPAMSYGQNMYVLNGGQMGEEVVLQGANVASSHGERMVLLERGGTTQAVNTGVLQMGSLSGSQVLLVDGGAQSGHVLQGTLKRGVAGSQGVVVVEGGQGGVLQGSLRKGVSTHGGSQGGLYHVENRGGSGVIQGSPQKSAGSVSGKVVSSGSTQRNVTTQKIIQEKIVTSQTTM